MSNLVINANSIYDRVIRIGRQTENLVSSITFNVNMWIEEYGLGECVLNVRRNGDGSAYPVPMTIADGMTTWTITDTDVAKKGRGEIQLKYIVGEKVKTSPIFTISVGESLVGDAEPPSGYEDWLAELGEMTAQVEAAKTSADQSAQTAQTAAQTATEKASEAEQAAEFAYNHYESARQSAVSAQASKTGAVQAAANAHESATEAAQSAQTAESAKQAAQTASESAQASAQNASDKAAEASESAANAQESATDAQSEADRAKTYADRAAEVELEIPTKVSQLENDLGYLTEHQSLADYVRKDVLYNMFPTDTASGAMASFPDGADDIPLKSLVVGIEPVQDLHGYDSPWPAGGGKNLFQTTAQSKTENGVTWTVNADGTITVSGTATGYTYLVVGYARVSSNMGMVTISGISTATNIAWGSLAVLDVNDNVLYTIIAGGTTAILSCDLSQYPEAYSIRVAVKRNNNVATSGTVKIQVEEGSTATDWTPYSNICPISGWTGMTVNANGTEIPISWESEAGTVYGGKLDVLTGVLTVDKAMITATEFYSYASSDLTYGRVVLPNALPTTSVATDYVTSKFPVDRSAAENTTRRVSGYAYFYFPTGTTREDAESVVNGTQIVYPVADPVTYQLTPHEVKSLLGQNNIWADTGDTSVTYRADIQRYIQKMVSQ